MIRFIDYEGRPIWINLKRIDSIMQTDTISRTTGKSGCVVHYHSGPSCFTVHMNETLDEVKKMIDEAKDGN